MRRDDQGGCDKTSWEWATGIIKPTSSASAVGSITVAALNSSAHDFAIDVRGIVDVDVSGAAPAM